MNNFFFTSQVEVTNKDTDIKESCCGSGFFRECESVEEFHRDFYKGKSLTLDPVKQPWSENITYYNSEFHQDFVIYNNELYVCINTTSGDKPDNSDNWLLAVPQIEGKVFYPNVDSNGNLSWSVLNYDSIPNTVNIKGPKGEKGEKGDKGDRGPKGEKGDRGKSGNGNFFVGKEVPDKNLLGYENDIYLDLTTGEIYQFNNKWISLGKINVDGQSSINLEWMDYE